MNSSGLTFGIYPLSAAGTPFGLAIGPEDNYEKIQLALKDLKGESKKLLPRNYLIYTKEWEEKMLSNADRYLDASLIGDLTIGCGDWTDKQELEIELNNWLDFIRKVINRYGSHLASLQITNEPNLSFMEGSKPYVLQALVEGVITKKNEVREKNQPIKIGFGSVPESPAAVNISHYKLFGLRDADSSKEDLFHQYGIMRDDYSPKPAYDTFKRLIRELGN
jgi:hypothetical protein